VTREQQQALPQVLGVPRPLADGLDEPHWAGLRDHRLLVQRCARCQGWQWAPEVLCHRCHSFEVGWSEVEPRGRIFSWTRVWHPAHDGLREAVPYAALVVELPHADGVRIIGNLLGDQLGELRVGIDVVGVFEDHSVGAELFTLLQWRREDPPES
jgi:uncharacterized protein